MAQQARPNVMGHNEPCRAQLAIWSRVVRAYCIAPFLGSCEGRGTSRRRPPETGRRSLDEVAAGVIDVADLEDEDDIEATGAARTREYGIELDATNCQSGQWQSRRRVVPLSALGTTVLVRDIILLSSTKERGNEKK